MPTLTKKPRATRHTEAGRRLIKSVKQAIAWSNNEHGENLNVRAAPVGVNHASLVDVKGLRQELGLSQSQFAARFGFNPATVKNWEQGRTQPDGPARTLLAVIAHNPSVVDAALRRAS